jgi:hypothetical protein
MVLLICKFDTKYLVLLVFLVLVVLVVLEVFWFHLSYKLKYSKLVKLFSKAAVSSKF